MEGNNLLRNVVQFVSDYTASHPRDTLITSDTVYFYFR